MAQVVLATFQEAKITRIVMSQESCIIQTGKPTSHEGPISVHR